MVAVEIGNNPPVVEGNGLSAKVFVGPLATGLNGAEEPGGSGGDRERGVAGSGEDFFDVFLFVRTQFASDAGSFRIIKGVEGADIRGGEFQVVVDGDEELRYLTVVLDKAGGDAVGVDGLQVMLLNKAGDLVFEVADLDAVSLVAGVDGADKTHNDGS